VKAGDRARIQAGEKKGYMQRVSVKYEDMTEAEIFRLKIKTEENRTEVTSKSEWNPYFKTNCNL
jgi:hypothetical protein